MGLDLNAIAKWASQNSKDIIVTWFSVLTRGPQAFDNLDLNQSSTLLYALKFMLFMALVDLVVHVPIAAKTGISLQNGLFPFWLVLEAYLEYFATGLILYGAMRLVGGKGSLQACIAAFCLLTAYLPLISVLMLPALMLIVPAMAKSSDMPQDLPQVADQLGGLSAWDLSSVLLSALFTTLMFVVFFRSVFKTFRALHRLSTAPAIFAFTGGLVCSAVFMTMFILPFLTAIYKGFAQHANALDLRVRQLSC